MPKPPRRQFAEGLLPLQHDYLRSVTKYISDVRRLRELIEQNKLPLHDLQTTLRLTNNLTGSGSTFGFPEISRTARDLHAALQELSNSNENTPGARRSQNHVLEKLLPFEEACLQAVSSHKIVSFRKRDKSLVERVANDAAEKTIYLVAPNPSALDFLLPEIAAQGLASSFVETAGTWTDRIPEGAQAILFYSADPARDLIGLPANLHGKEAFVLVSPDQTFEARLAAVKAGGSAFFSPAAEAKTIIATLKTLAGWNGKPSSRNRVLLIYSDETAAAFYSQSLEQAGLDVKTMCFGQDGFELPSMTALDLIIVPFSLPECTGVEVSLVVRQLAESQGIPIVILAAQKEIETIEMAPMARQDIYFIVKPFTPSQLVAKVKTYLEKEPAGRV